MEDINEYKVAVKRLADTNSNFVFTNSGADHARVVMETIFKTSKEHINIFAGDLNGAVSKGDYLLALENYLKSGRSISVLLEKYDEKKTSEALELLLKYKKSGQTNISIAIANPKSLDASIKNNHFTVGDNHMFRFETDMINYTAVCNFNDPASSERFNNIFFRLSQDSIAIN